MRRSYDLDGTEFIILLVCLFRCRGDGLQRGVAGAEHRLASIVHVLSARDHLPAAALPPQPHLRTGRLA